MHKLLLFLLIIICFIQSCTIRQEYHFNKDFSGTVKSSVDFTMLSNVMKTADTTGKKNSLTDSIDLSFKKAAVQLEAAGTTNVKWGWNDNKTAFYLSYDFKDIETLNKALTTTSPGSESLLGNQSKTKSTTYFIKKGNKLTYKSAKMEGDSLFHSSQMKTMSEYYKYELIFSFDQKIKKVSSKNAIIQDDGKSIQMKGNLFDLVSPKYDSDLTINLK
jgi:hypothetical protein